MKDTIELKNIEIALILDGFINGLGIVRSLKMAENIPVAILCKKGAALAQSNKIDFIFYYRDYKEFEQQLLKINEIFKSVIPYYCKDNHLKIVFDLKDVLTNFKIYDFDLTLLEKNAHASIYGELNEKPNWDFWLFFRIRFRQGRFLQLYVL